jgi:hypothetical protein
MLQHLDMLFNSNILHIRVVFIFQQTILKAPLRRVLMNIGPMDFILMTTVRLLE